jgi:hypothetical protein
LDLLFERSSSFIAWICPLFKPQVFVDYSYIYFEGDDIAHIYFLQEGACGFVIPKHNNIKYVNVQKGNHFGFVDILGSIFKNEDVSMEDWFFRKDKMKRHFTLRSDVVAEMLVLSTQDIHRIQLEFQEIFEEIMDEEKGLLQKLLPIKFKTIKSCQTGEYSDIRCYDLYEVYEMINQTSDDESSCHHTHDHDHDHFQEENKFVEQMEEKILG